MTWTADATEPTADATDYTADGYYQVPIAEVVVSGKMETETELSGSIK